MQMTNMATSEPVIAERDDAIAGAIERRGLLLAACWAEQNRIACLLTDPDAGRRTAHASVTSGSEAGIGADGYKAFICFAGRESPVFQSSLAIPALGRGFVSENTWTAGVAPGAERDVLYSARGRYRCVSGGLAGWLCFFRRLAWDWSVLDWISPVTWGNEQCLR